MRWINRVPVLIPLGGEELRHPEKASSGTSAPLRGVSWGRTGTILSLCSWEDTWGQAQNTLEGLYLYHWSGNTQEELELLVAEDVDGCMADGQPWLLTYWPQKVLLFLLLCSPILGSGCFTVFNSLSLTFVCPLELSTEKRQLKLGKQKQQQWVKIE